MAPLRRIAQYQASGILLPNNDAGAVMATIAELPRLAWGASAIPYRTQQQATINPPIAHQAILRFIGFPASFVLSILLALGSGQDWIPSAVVYLQQASRFRAIPLRFRCDSGDLLPMARSPVGPMTRFSPDVRSVSSPSIPDKGSNHGSRFRATRSVATASGHAY